MAPVILLGCLNSLEYPFSEMDVGAFEMQPCEVFDCFPELSEADVHAQLFEVLEDAVVESDCGMVRPLHLLVDTRVDLGTTVPHLLNKLPTVALELLGLEDTIVDQLDRLPRRPHSNPYAHPHDDPPRLATRLLLLLGAILLFFLSLKGV
jgi:hypothetical protein